VALPSARPRAPRPAPTLKELADSANASIRPNAKAIEVIFDEKTKRTSGVAYLDLTNPDDPKLEYANASFVIVSCGAVQTARLLLLSGPSAGLGNSSNQLGANATFHVFGFGVRITLAEKFQGLLHRELGPTGNTTTFATYSWGTGQVTTWIKGGHLTSAAKKNPLEDAAMALGRVEESPHLRLLCLRGKGPRNRRTPKQPNEFPPPHPGGQDGGKSALDAALSRGGHGAAL
jgi:choline dehydrogenase-like flavoprotein